MKFILVDWSIVENHSKSPSIEEDIYSQLDAVGGLCSPSFNASVAEKLREKVWNSGKEGATSKQIHSVRSAHTVCEVVTGRMLTTISFY